MNDMLNECMDELRARGPDETRHYFNKYAYVGFHRLMVSDTTEIGSQPMLSPKGNVSACNAEIFNYEYLAQKYNVSAPMDCSIVLAMYDMRYSLDNNHDTVRYICSQFDGEFAGIIYNSESKTMHAFRDPYGVRPLFYGLDHGERIYFASEAKALTRICSFIEQVTPGFVMTVSEKSGMITHYSPYISFDLHKSASFSSSLPLEFYTRTINYLITDAVKKRTMSKRPVCALLSGGLDSSLVASLLAKELGSEDHCRLHTFSIGLPGSPDLMYAEKVAKHIGSEHQSVLCSKEDFLDAIPQVIKTIESYDVTTVRASVGNYLIAKWIAEHTDFKVVYNGDFADEVMSGYLYFHHAPNASAFHEETINLLRDITYFDSLRSDRTISAHGLEARVPYADKAFVEFYLQIPPELRMGRSFGGIEKCLIRKAFEHDSLLPLDVLWRKKEAFSDGVSSTTDSWHNIIKTHVDNIVSHEEFAKERCTWVHNPPQTKEAYYYRKIFEGHYCGHDNIIPYMWMPKWSKATDPSARELITN